MMSLALLQFISWQSHQLLGQSSISLEECGVSYIDPQDSSNNAQGRDTIIYTSYFPDTNRLRSFHIDINAFGGQQIDRTSVFAIMPADTLKFLGQLAFGNCLGCKRGFVLVFNDSTLVEGLTDRDEMDLWLSALNQPAFALQGNLQSLVGVGRVSGYLPPCAIGITVQYVVNSNPANATTEFSTHILCPESIKECTVSKEVRVDCQTDSIFLEALIPSQCYSEQVQVVWRNQQGFVSAGSTASLPLSGNEGKYYLTVEDDCCIYVDSFTVENPSFAKAGTDRTVCQGEQVTLSGTGGVSHFWELPDGSTESGASYLIDNVGVEMEGAFVLHAFNEANCEDTDTLLLRVNTPPQPEVEVQGACLGDTATFAVDNAQHFISFVWLDPSGAPLPGGLIPNLQPDRFGSHTLIATDSVGCEVSKTFEVSGNELPSIDVTMISSCDSTTAQLSPPNFTYQWTEDHTGSTITTAEGGVYAVTITDADGCRSVETVEIPLPEGPGFSTEIEQPMCPGEFGTIEIIADDPQMPLIFSIDGGEQYTLSSQFEGLSPGEYLVTVQDEFGCIVKRPVSLLKPDTMGVELDIDYLEVRPNTELTLSATTIGNIEEIQWLPKAIDSGDPSTTFVANQNLDVRIIVKDKKGCHATDGFPLTVILSPIYVPNVFSPDSDGNNDGFTFFSDQLSGEMIERLSVFDRYGNLLFTTSEIELNDTSLGWDGTHEGKPLNTGIYTYFGIVRFGNGAKKKLKGDVLLLR